MPADLRARRLALGLSQATLAARLGVSENTVWRWETGRWPIEHPELLRLALDRLSADCDLPKAGPAPRATPRAGP